MEERLTPTGELAGPGLDAWTPRALAEALGIEEELAERLADQTVGDGKAVRISQGDLTFYVPGTLSERLLDLGVVPVEGERLAERKAEATDGEKGRLLREVALRERARRMKDGDR